MWREVEGFGGIREGRGEVEAQHDSPINMPSCFLSFFKGRKERFT